MRTRVVKAALAVIGTAVGLWHCFISLQTIFVMKDEGLLVLGLVFGPLLTLPAVLSSAWKPRVGGWILTVAACVFLLTSVLHYGIELYQIGVAIAQFVLPMALLGVGFIWCSEEQLAIPEQAPSLIER